MTTAAALDVRTHFPAARGYLDTATCGLPSTATVAAVQEHLTTWSAGGGSLPVFHDPVERSRAAFAALVGVPVDDVAVGSQVSVAVGMVAASLPAGSHVVLPDNDFTSLLWPFLVRDDLRCELVPLAEVPDAVARGCDWVAASTVQSAGGAVLDLVALRAAADATGARVLLDATQSAGWLPLDAAQWDVVVAGAYKWLLSPRGTAFTAVSRGALPLLRASAAGWYAGEDGPARTTAAPPGWRPARGGSTSPRRGRAGPGPRPRWSCSSTSASRPCTGTTSAWPTPSATGWACRLATAPSSAWTRPSSRCATAASAAPAVPARPGWPSTCTTTRTTSTPQPGPWAARARRGPARGRRRRRRRPPARR
jgi:hypothetical protein